MFSKGHVLFYFLSSCSKKKNRHTNDILNYMLSSSFYPLISRPTRITSTSATLIDNIFINSLEDNFTCGLILTDISDHLPIFQITDYYNDYYS